LIGLVLNSMHTSKLVRDHTSTSALWVPFFKFFDYTAIYDYIKLFCSKDVFLFFLKRICSSMRSIVKYRTCECERGILKGVFKRVTEQGVWKITTDQKLRELYKKNWSGSRYQKGTFWVSEACGQIGPNKHGRKDLGQQIRR